jgi:hypothetical protein
LPDTLLSHERLSEPYRGNLGRRTESNIFFSGTHWDTRALSARFLCLGYETPLPFSLPHSFLVSRHSSLSRPGLVRAQSRVAALRSTCAAMHCTTRFVNSTGSERSCLALAWLQIPFLGVRAVRWFLNSADDGDGWILRPRSSMHGCGSLFSPAL